MNLSACGRIRAGDGKLQHHGQHGSGPIAARIGIVPCFEHPDTAVISFQVRLAAEKLHKGGIIACPTESVYGLSCDPLNQSAIERLIALKQRPDTKGFILIASRIEQLEPFVSIPDKRREEIEQTWPGPVTWVLPAKADLPPWIGGGRDTIAARVTAHAQMAAICDLYGGCLVSTSANISGQPPARNPMQVRRQFDELLDMIVGGKLGGLARPTPIRDAVSGKFIRR
jgi:L-threonylcarbamoyladenylate synthase